MCERMNCTACSNLCGSIAEKPTDFLSVFRSIANLEQSPGIFRLMVPACSSETSIDSHFSQADDAVVLVPPTHSDLPMPHRLWATGSYTSFLV